MVIYNEPTARPSEIVAISTAVQKPTRGGPALRSDTLGGTVGQTVGRSGDRSEDRKVGLSDGRMAHGGTGVWSDERSECRTNDTVGNRMVGRTVAWKIERTVDQRGGRTNGRTEGRTVISLSASFDSKRNLS